MTALSEINVKYEPFTLDNAESLRRFNIIVDGEYWGQKELFKPTDTEWYVVFTPSAFQPMEPYTDRTIGVFVQDNDIDMAIRQLILLTKLSEAPF